MINWQTFKSLIGNKRRKYVMRGNQKYLFISYNDELQKITVKHVLSDRILEIMPLSHFIEYFTFYEMTNELPIF
ncbi:hypothetical protein ES703_63771 [subsurface metagenome]